MVAHGRVVGGTGEGGIGIVQQVYSQPHRPHIAIKNRLGRDYRGVNFASQDYLGLATDPHVIDAACNAARRYGVHSAGSAALMGLTEITLDLEERMRIKHVMLQWSDIVAARSIYPEPTLERQGPKVR